MNYITGKNNRFPFLDILGYLKNTQKNPKFGRVRQVPIRELGWEFPGWDLSHFAKFGILWVFFKYPKIPKNGNPLFFPVYAHGVLEINFASFVSGNGNMNFKHYEFKTKRMKFKLRVKVNPK